MTNHQFRKGSCKYCYLIIPLLRFRNFLLLGYVGSNNIYYFRYRHSFSFSECSSEVLLFLLHWLGNALSFKFELVKVPFLFLNVLLHIWDRLARSLLGRILILRWGDVALPNIIHVIVLIIVTTFLYWLLIIRGVRWMVLLLLLLLLIFLLL